MYRQALSTLSVLFFMLGLLTGLNTVLLPSLREVYKLGYFEAAFIQLSFFGAYGLFSLGASRTIERMGHQKGITQGFLLAAAGCTLFFPAVLADRYFLFLIALFVLAIGMVLLQVAANPYVSMMGTKEETASRLSMLQAFNSLGTFLAPLIGSAFILEHWKETVQKSELHLFYLFLALALLLIALLQSRTSLPPNGQLETTVSEHPTHILSNKKFLMGMMGIFLYVGAEVTIGSFLINYVMERTRMQQIEAAYMLSFYWGGAMAGRFLGIFTLKEFPPGKVLKFHGLLAISLILISLNSYGLRAVYSLVLVGLCNSIMFPCLFGLAIQELPSKYLQKAAGILSLAIIGGAVLPVLTGKVADTFGLRTALLLPAVGYGYIALLGALESGEKLAQSRM